MDRLTQIDLVTAAAARTGMTKKDMKTALDAFLDEIRDSVKSGKSVGLRGFGTFSLKVRPQREARNPRNGETITVAASEAIAFKAAK